MSRSKRKPIIKDKPRNSKASTYYRKVRRKSKQALKEGKEIPDSKEVVNGYDYCDYKIDLRWSKNKKSKSKYSRK